MELGTLTCCSEVVSPGKVVALLFWPTLWLDWLAADCSRRVVAGVASSICCRGDGWSLEAAGVVVPLSARAEGAAVAQGASWDGGLDGVVV